MFSSRSTCDYVLLQFSHLCQVFFWTVSHLHSVLHLQLYWKYFVNSMCLTGSEGKICVSTIIIFFICILPLLEAYFLLIMFPFIIILLWSLFPPILIYADYINPPFFSILVVSTDCANMSEYLCLGLPCLVSSGRAFLLLKEMVERHKKLFACEELLSVSQLYS